jgi:hypothetical protein
MGPRRYELNRELEFGRPAQLGATPFADSQALATGNTARGESRDKKAKSGVQNLKDEAAYINKSTAKGGSV